MANDTNLFSYPEAHLQQQVNPINRIIQVGVASLQGERQCHAYVDKQGQSIHWQSQ